MVKNVHGGKKAKKSKNTTPNRLKQQLLRAEQDQIYGHVEKVLGDMRCSVLCMDGIERVCRIRGKFKRRVWINTGDVVLVALRTFEDKKADIIHKYMPEEIKSLDDLGEYCPTKVKKIDPTNLSSIDDLINDEEKKEKDSDSEMDDITFGAI